MKIAYIILQGLSLLILATLCGCAVTPTQVAESKAPHAIPVGASAKPIQFQRIVTKIPLGEQIGQYQYGWGCLPGSAIGWRGGRLNITDEELIEAFRKELQTQNYSVVGDPYALFGDIESLKAEILAGGVVDKVDIRVCYPYSGGPNVSIGNTNMLKGGVFMQVAWQLYSRAEGRVVYETTTQGSYKSEEAVPGGLALFLRNAFAANVRNLLADPGFHALMLKKGDEKPRGHDA